jgi:Tol biopolymer transport system component
VSRTRHAEVCLALVGAVLVFAACQHPFVRNPNLRLLRSEAAGDKHPIVAPNGSEVYYISGDSWLCKLDISSDLASTLRSGWLQAIALSPDGTRLALLGHELLLADTTGAILQTLVPSESLGNEPVDVEFGHDGSHVFYSIQAPERGAWYYRVSLDGTGRELVHESYGSAESPRGEAGFVLTGDDSVVDFFSGRHDWPQLSPLDDDVMVYALNWLASGDINVTHLSSDSAVGLGCNPYRDSRVAYPSWFPDGRKIVYCATDNVSVYRYELWMLDSVDY